MMVLRPSLTSDDLKLFVGDGDPEWLDEDDEQEEDDDREDDDVDEDEFDDSRLSILVWSRSSSWYKLERIMAPDSVMYSGW